MKEITLDDAIEKKLNTERAILLLLRQLENDTDLYIEDCKFIRRDNGEYYLIINLPL